MQSRGCRVASLCWSVSTLCSMRGRQQVFEVSPPPGHAEQTCQTTRSASIGLHNRLHISASAISLTGGSGRVARVTSCGHQLYCARLGWAGLGYYISVCRCVLNDLLSLSSAAHGDSVLQETTNNSLDSSSLCQTFSLRGKASFGFFLSPELWF